MKVLIDTNIILDVLCRRPGFYENASRIFKLCEVRKMSGIISALSVPNIMYILRKELDADKIREILEKLMLIFSVVDLTADDLIKAADISFGDYEDAIQSVCAARIKANYIVTRNTKDFLESKVPSIEPRDLLDRI